MSPNTQHTSLIDNARTKSRHIAYLLWIVIGSLGAHRFYTGRFVTAILQICLAILSLLTVGLAFLALCIWLLVDVFLIPGWIAEHNLTQRRNATPQT